MSDHNHPEIEDRITAEMALIRTELGLLRAELGGRIDAVAGRVDLLRQDTRRGFADVTQVLGQILARLPEQP